MKVTPFIGSGLIVLGYIPKSQRKDGEFPLSECSIPKSAIKIDNKHN